jgi:hypothetical protein
LSSDTDVYDIPVYVKGFHPRFMKRSSGETANTVVLTVSHSSMLLVMYNLFNIYLNSYVKCKLRLKQVLYLKDLLNFDVSLIVMLKGC